MEIYPRASFIASFTASPHPLKDQIVLRFMQFLENLAVGVTVN